MGKKKGATAAPGDWRARTAKWRKLLSEYEHRKCGSVTVVSDDILETEVLDPYYHSPTFTYCAGCGNYVPTKDCIVSNGKTLLRMTNRLRSETPWSYRLVRFLAIPAAGAIVGGLLGWLVADRAAVWMIGAFAGVGLFSWLVARLTIAPLRRAGHLWG